MATTAEERIDTSDDKVADGQPEQIVTNQGLGVRMPGR